MRHCFLSLIHCLPFPARFGSGIGVVRRRNGASRLRHGLSHPVHRGHLFHQPIVLVQIRRPGCPSRSRGRGAQEKEEEINMSRMKN